MTKFCSFIEQFLEWFATVNNTLTTRRACCGALL